MKFKVKVKAAIHVAGKEYKKTFTLEIKAVDKEDCNQYVYGLLKSSGTSFNYEIENENV